MAGTPNQKAKVLCLLRVLAERTDPEHTLSLAELSEELSRRGFLCERKSLYRDLKALSEAGFSVGVIRSRDVRYYWAGSPLTREDHLLLSNLLRITPNLPRKRKAELSRKLRSFVPLPQQRDCMATLIGTVSDDAVTERVYSNVEFLFDSILSGRKVRFLYKGTDSREMPASLKRKSTMQTVSPYRILWHDGYFLVGADSKDQLMFYRVDRIESLSSTDFCASDIREVGGDLDFDLDQYIKGFFVSLEEPVSMVFRVSRSFLSLAERKFPSDAVIELIDEDSYLISCDVPADESLFGWLLLHSEEIRLLCPETMVRRLTEFVRIGSSVYGNDTAE